MLFFVLFCHIEFYFSTLSFSILLLKYWKDMKLSWFSIFFNFFFACSSACKLFEIFACLETQWIWILWLISYNSLQFRCSFFIKCVRNSRFSNHVIALTQSVKIQISDAILIAYTFFVQNSIALSITNNFASIRSIYLSEFQFFVFVSALKNRIIATSVVFEFFASLV